MHILRYPDTEHLNDDDYIILAGNTEGARKYLIKTKIEDKISSVSDELNSVTGELNTVKTNLQTATQNIQKISSDLLNLSIQFDSLTGGGQQIGPTVVNTLSGNQQNAVPTVYAVRSATDALDVRIDSLEGTFFSHGSYSDQNLQLYGTTGVSLANDPTQIIPVVQIPSSDISDIRKAGYLYINIPIRFNYGQYGAFAFEADIILPTKNINSSAVSDGKNVSRIFGNGIVDISYSIRLENRWVSISFTTVNGCYLPTSGNSWTVTDLRNESGKVTVLTNGFLLAW